jgi:hypothetical protein
MNDIIDQRLSRIETLLEALLTQKQAKEKYTTAEVADALGKAEYTVREWCRKKQIPAEKALNNRGWLISHATLLRLRNGELPLPEQVG